MFARLDPEELQTCFLAWVRGVTGEAVAAGVVDSVTTELRCSLSSLAPEHLAVLRLLLV